jgi:hypothetical protein
MQFWIQLDPFSSGVLFQGLLIAIAESKSISSNVSMGYLVIYDVELAFSETMT